MKVNYKRILGIILAIAIILLAILIIVSLPTSDDMHHMKMLITAAMDKHCANGDKDACQQLDKRKAFLSLNEENQIGTIFHKGEYHHVDDAAAIRWYRMAAEQNYADAQYNLGMMYARGDGIPRDYVAADMWLSLAAAQGNKDARNSIGPIEQSLTPEQKALAQKEAQEWKPVKPESASPQKP